MLFAPDKGEPVEDAAKITLEDAAQYVVVSSMPRAAYEF